MGVLENALEKQTRLGGAKDYVCCCAASVIPVDDDAPAVYYGKNFGIYIREEMLFMYVCFFLLERERGRGLLRFHSLWIR